MRITKKTRHRRIALLFLSPILLVCQGCLVNCHRSETIRESEPRQSLRFESPAAMQAFNGRVNSQSNAERRMAKQSFCVPFLMSLSHEKMLSSNAYYNERLAEYDTNADGVMSNIEVAAYCPDFGQTQNVQNIAAQPQRLDQPIGHAVVESNPHNVVQQVSTDKMR